MSNEKVIHIEGTFNTTSFLCSNSRNSFFRFSLKCNFVLCCTHINIPGQVEHERRLFQSKANRRVKRETHASFTQFLPLLLFSTIFHIIDAFVSMYWAVKLENRKRIKCKIAGKYTIRIYYRVLYGVYWTMPPFLCQ